MLEKKPILIYLLMREINLLILENGVILINQFFFTNTELKKRLTSFCQSVWSITWHIFSCQSHIYERDYMRRKRKNTFCHVLCLVSHIYNYNIIVIKTRVRWHFGYFRLLLFFCWPICTCIHLNEMTSRISLEYMSLTDIQDLRSMLAYK